MERNSYGWDLHSPSDPPPSFPWPGGWHRCGLTISEHMHTHPQKIFGRRPVLLGSLLLFAVGSAVCGAAMSMGMLIGGRSTYDEAKMKPRTSSNRTCTSYPRSWRRRHNLFDADYCRRFGLFAGTRLIQWLDIHVSIQFCRGTDYFNFTTTQSVRYRRRNRTCCWRELGRSRAVEMAFLYGVHSI
jgi:hypothetical protein